MEAIRIDYIDGGILQTITFDHFEFETLIEKEKQKSEVQWLQDNSPVLTYTSVRWKEFKLVLQAKYSYTSTQIEILRAVDTVLYFYYDYVKNPKMMIPVKVLPDTPTYFFGGDKDAEPRLVLDLIETTGNKTFTFESQPLGR